MKVFLSGEELLHVLELVMKSPMKDSADNARLVNKLKEPIVSLLEKEEDRMSKGSYESWLSSEKQKIDELKSKNEVLASQREVVIQKKD